MSDFTFHEHNGKPCQHTHSNEFCEPCDSGYRSYGCMVQADTPVIQRLPSAQAGSTGAVENAPESQSSKETEEV